MGVRIQQKAVEPPVATPIEDEATVDEPSQVVASPTKASLVKKTALKKVTARPTTVRCRPAANAAAQGPSSPTPHAKPATDPDSIPDACDVELFKAWKVPVSTKLGELRKQIVEKGIATSIPEAQKFDAKQYFSQSEVQQCGMVASGLKKR